MCAKKIAAGFMSLALTLTMILVVTPQPSKAGYDKYKLLTIATHYYDSAGDFCRKKIDKKKVPIHSTHYSMCHLTATGGRNKEACKSIHPPLGNHGYTKAYDETFAFSVTDWAADCVPYGNAP